MVEFFTDRLFLSPAWAWTIVALIECSIFIIPLVAGGDALVFIWLERKVSGRIQDRLGPTRVGGKFGWLQTLADGIKLIAKEDITAQRRRSAALQAGALRQLCGAFAAYSGAAVCQRLGGQCINVAVFFIMAVLGLEVFGVILAGYASGSKWSLFGAMREAAQVVSYEVPLGMCVVVPVLIFGTDGSGHDRQNAGGAGSRIG